MYPGVNMPTFVEGDWVEVNETCLIEQYVGKIVQITNINYPETLHGRYEYTCEITEHHDQVFWESELTLSKIIPINGVVSVDRRFCNKSSTITKKTDDKKIEEKEEDKTIWV